MFQLCSVCCSLCRTKPTSIQISDWAAKKKDTRCHSAALRLWLHAGPLDARARNKNKFECALARDAVYEQSNDGTGSI